LPLEGLRSRASYLEAEVEERLAGCATSAATMAGPGRVMATIPERVVTSSIGPITIRRPRVRGITHESALIAKYRRRLPSIDKTIHQL